MLVNCKAGCSQSNVIAALRERGLWPGTTEPGDADGDHLSYYGEPILTRYVYEDEHGKALYLVGRTPSKRFPQWQSGAGPKEWGLNGTRRVPYRLPQVIEAVKAGVTVYTAEGEKDVQSIERAGGVATCNPGGAGKWRPEYSEVLRDATVIVVQDRDDPGREHAAKVVAALQGIAASVTLVEPIEGKDVSDHLAAGHTLDELRPVAVAGGSPQLGASGVPTVRWWTPAEIAAHVPEQPFKFSLYGYKGGITEIAAKIKTGKTTLVMAMIKSTVHGEPFLGEPTQRTKVILLTEERQQTINAAMQRVGLTGSDVAVLFRHDTRSLPWEEAVAAAHRRAIEIGAHVLVVDTLTDWASVGVDAENDAGAALEAMRPLQMVAAAGLAVIVVRHDRKSGGELGDSARGSSAFGGAADILVSVRRVDGQGHENRRVLLAVGRFDGIPAHMVVELKDGVYTALGEATDIEYREVMAIVLDTLLASKAKAATEEELLERLGEHGSRSTLKRVLKELMAKGSVARDRCAGATGRAYGYWLTTVVDNELSNPLSLDGHIISAPTCVECGAAVGYAGELCERCEQAATEEQV